VGDSAGKEMAAVKNSRKSIALGGRPLRRQAGVNSIDPFSSGVNGSNPIQFREANIISTRTRSVSLPCARIVLA
jgi:hypothetical protein